MSWTAFLITTAALYPIIVARYFLIAGFFYWALWKRPGNLLHARKLTDTIPAKQLIRSEIRWSVVASAIYTLPGALIIEAWKAGGTAIYMDVSEYGWGWYLASVPVYLFLQDTYFYWTHRWMHQPAVFPLVHRVHHDSRQPTPWAGFSFHPVEAIVGAAFLPLLIFFIPIHVSALVFLLILMTIVSVTNHSGFEILSDRSLRGLVGRHWISAAHHNLHHQNFHCNFGLYFRFWDRLMGTDRLEEDYGFLQDAGAEHLAEARGRPGG